MAKRKLTKRQTEFLRSLLDLWYREQGPIHYTDLAERVGVSRFTAYDMLKLLEEKGMAERTYSVSDDGGPGRSTVLFRPTQLAEQRLQAIRQIVPDASWEAFRETAIEQIRRGPAYDAEMVEQMLARVPSSDSSRMQFCLELMTVLALRAGELPQRAGRLPLGRGDTAEQLLLAVGYHLGLVAALTSDEAWQRELMAHVSTFRDILPTLSTSERGLLLVQLTFGRPHSAARQDAVEPDNFSAKK